MKLTCLISTLIDFTSAELSLRATNVRPTDSLSPTAELSAWKPIDMLENTHVRRRVRRERRNGGTEENSRYKYLKSERNGTRAVVTNRERGKRFSAPLEMRHYGTSSSGNA